MGSLFSLSVNEEAKMRATDYFREKSVLRPEGKCAEVGEG